MAIGLQYWYLREGELSLGGENHLLEDKNGLENFVHLNAKGIISLCNYGFANVFPVLYSIE